MSTALASGELAFVGRQAELAELGGCLREALAGRPQVTFLEGDAGIGKTRLAREIEAEAQALGMQTAFGRFVEGGAVPFLAFATAFVRQCERAGLLTPGSALGPLAAHLRRLGGLATDEPANPEDAGRGLGLAVGRAALALAQRRPLLFVVDDLHWAEPAAVDLFADLARAVADAAEREPVMICVIALMRPLTDDGPLQRVLERLRRERVVSRLVLGGMDELEVNELVVEREGSACAPDLLGALQEATHGNPLFVLEILGQLEATGALRRDDGRLLSRINPEALPLPKEVTRAIADRVALLPDALRQTLTVAALAGDEFTGEGLAIVTGLSEEDALDWADAAVAARFLTETGAAYRFAHPVIRHVFQEQASAGRRRRMHGEIAERLITRYGDDEAWALEIAGQLEHTADRSARAGVFFQRAGDVAFQRMSWGRSAAMRDLALGCADFVAALGDDDKAALVLDSGNAHYRNMDFRSSTPRFDEAIDRFRSLGDTVGWGAALEGRIRIDVSHVGFTERPTFQVERFREFEEAADSDPASLSKVKAIWAEALYRAQDPSSEGAAREAFALAELHGNRRAAWHASFSLGLGLALRLDWKGAAEQYAETIRRANELADPWFQGWGLQNLPVALAGIGELEEALVGAATASAHATAIGDWAIVASTNAWGAAIACALGRFDEVERRARLARTALNRSEFAWAGPPLYSALALARAQRGQRAAALDAVAKLPPLVSERGAAPYELMVRALCGEAATVRQEIEGNPERMTWTVPLTNASLPFIAVRGFVAIVARSEVLARAVLPQLEEASARGVIVAPNPGLLIKGLIAGLLEVLGGGEALDALLLVAEREAREIGAKPDLVRLLLVKARRSRAAGRAAITGPAREEAEQLIDELGLGAFYRDEEAALGAPGREAGLSPAIIAGPGGDLRFQILCEIARGAPPESIPETLLVSPATVGVAVERIEAELGIRDRDDALRWLEARQLIPPAAEPVAELHPVTPMTFLFADIVGSTPINAAVGDAAWAQFVLRHNARIDREVRRHGGRSIKTMGDGTFAAFPRPSAALACGLAIQNVSDEVGGVLIGVRVGLHVGGAYEQRGADGRLDYFGLAVTTAARVCAQASGGEVLVTEDVLEGAAGAERFAIAARGLFVLKGLEAPARLYSIQSRVV